MSKLFNVDSNSVYPIKNVHNSKIYLVKKVLNQKIFAFIKKEIVIVVLCYLPFLLISQVFNLLGLIPWFFVVHILYLVILMALVFGKWENLPITKYLKLMLFSKKTTHSVDQIFESTKNDYQIRGSQMTQILELKQLSNFDDNLRLSIESLAVAFENIKIVCIKEPVNEALADTMTDEYLKRRKPLNNELYEQLRQTTYETLYGTEINKVYAVLRTDLDGSNRQYSNAINQLKDLREKIIKNYPLTQIVTDESISNQLF